VHTGLSTHEADQLHCRCALHGRGGRLHRGQSDLNSFPFGSQCWQNSCGGLRARSDHPERLDARTPYYRYFPNTPDSKRGTFLIQPSPRSSTSLTTSWRMRGWARASSRALDHASVSRNYQSGGCALQSGYSKTYELGLKSQCSIITCRPMRPSFSPTTTASSSTFNAAYRRCTQRRQRRHQGRGAGGSVEPGPWILAQFLRILY